jgi:hypothetical protein
VPLSEVAVLLSPEQSIMRHMQAPSPEHLFSFQSLLGSLGSLNFRKSV